LRQISSPQAWGRPRRRADSSYLGSAIRVSPRWYEVDGGGILDRQISNSPVSGACTASRCGNREGFMNPLSLIVEADFEAFVDAIPDAVAIVDERGRIVLVNAQTEELFGYSATELTGQPIEILIPERFPQNHPHHRKSFEQNPRARPMGTGLDLYGLRKNRSEFPVEISLSPLKTRTSSASRPAMPTSTTATARPMPAYSREST
jgi:PAS domain S-box-containing protein